MAGAAKKVVVGKLTAPWGVKGWIKVHPYTAEPGRLLEFARLWYQRDGQWLPLKLAEGRTHGPGLVVQPAGCTDRDQVQAYQQCLVAVDDSELPALEEDEYYWHQLQGLQVVTDMAGQPVLLGQVDHLLETGANDVLVVRPCTGSLDQRERLIPYLPGRFVQAVDLAAGLIRVDWDPAF